MLDRNNPVPLYHQLELIIKDNIESGHWKENEKIPSENELSKLYGVSRVTIRSVITKFVDSGMMYRIQGKGTFIAAPKIITGNVSYVGIRDQLEKQGYDTKTKVIAFEKIKANVPISKKLEIPVGSEVIYIERLRTINDVPFSLHRSYVPTNTGVKLEIEQLETEQLCHILSREYQLFRHKVVETLESTTSDSYESKLLGVKNNHHFLLLEDVIFDSNNTPFEYSKVLFRGDRIKMKFEYDHDSQINLQ